LKLTVAVSPLCKPALPALCVAMPIDPLVGHTFVLFAAFEVTPVNSDCTTEVYIPATPGPARIPTAPAYFATGSLCTAVESFNTFELAALLLPDPPPPHATNAAVAAISAATPNDRDA
jgi:hypothetical protein